ncbi:MAG TPA: hypothetical protein V6D16_08470 [Candidatus Obscuribacterales bacterium]
MSSGQLGVSGAGKVITVGAERWQHSSNLQKLADARSETLEAGVLPP